MCSWRLSRFGFVMQLTSISDIDFSAAQPRTFPARDAALERTGHTRYNTIERVSNYPATAPTTVPSPRVTLLCRGLFIALAGQGNQLGQSNIVFITVFPYGVDLRVDLIGRACSSLDFSLYQIQPIAKINNARFADVSGPAQRRRAFEQRT